MTIGLPEQPTFEVIYDWQTSKFEYLEFLPGYQSSMLNTRPNLEFLFVELKHRNAKYYDLVYKILTNESTKNNQLKVKTKSIDCVLVMWFTIS